MLGGVEILTVGIVSYKQVINERVKPFSFLVEVVVSVRDVLTKGPLS